MMQNLGSTWQRLESNQFPLERGVYNIISFDLASFVPHIGQSMRLFAVIEFDGHEIARIDMSRTPRTFADLASDWNNYSFAIRDSQFTSRSVSISFLLGEENGVASAASTVFIDNLDITTRSAINRSDVNAYADLGNAILFAESFFLVENNASNAQVSAVDAVGGGQFLRIQTSNYQNTSVRNTLTEVMDGGEFFEYRVTMRIVPGTGDTLTYEPITIFDDEGRPTEDPSDWEFGINMHLAGFEGGFSNLQPSDLRGMRSFYTDENGGEWTTLSFFIHADATSDLSLIVEFGNYRRAVWADVEILSMELVSIDSEVFNNARRSVEEDPYYHVHFAIMNEEYLPDIGGGDDGEDQERDRSLDFLIWPSIIMGAAIIFAVVAFGIRRFKFKTHIKKKHTSYAADDEVSVRS